MTTKIDQKSYLQKYLGGASAEKKRKKKKNVKGKGFKIIDDDLDLSKMRALDGDELDIMNEGEDAPQVAGIIDERPEELKKLDAFQSSSKWRVISQDDGFNSKLKVVEVRRNIKQVEKENEVVFGKMYSDSEDEQKNDSDASPPRKSNNENGSKTKKSEKHNSNNDSSPPRRDKSNNKKQNYDSDVSPQRKNARKGSDSNNSPPIRKSAKSNTKYDANKSPLRKHTNEATSNNKRSRNDQTNNKQMYNQKYNDASPPRGKDNSQNRNMVRKPSRWGNFEDEANRRSESPNNRKEKLKDSPDRRKYSGNKKRNDSDISPPRKSRRESPKRNRSSDSDESPPRRRKQSPETRKYDKITHSKERKYLEQAKRSHKRNQGSDSDVSLPRQEGNRNDRKRNESSRNKRNESSKNSDSDLSPPRQERNKYKSATTNQSKRNGSDSDLSPPRKERNKTHDKRNTNQRKTCDSDSDLSPPRKRKNKNYEERSKRNSDEPGPSNKKMEKTLDGKNAGLQDARQLKQENEAFRRREEEAFKNMTDEMSGRNAKIVSRKGKRETSEDRQKQIEKAERQKILDEKYKKWTRGVKQVESQQAAVEDFLHEAAKPLARYKGDGDLESKLKDAERQGDPMLKYMREKKRERGELGPEKPIYKGNFPLNRFNIRPGYRWDGVDRSNGYEKKYFDQQSKRKAQEEEAYKWSIEEL